MTAVLFHLGFEDIMHLSRTCRAFQGLAKELRVGNYNIDRELKGWFTDPKDFRSLQAQFGAVIVEYFARNFFTRTTAELDCLDIYLPRKHRKVFRAYLKKEGYGAHYGEDERDWFQKIDVEGNAWTVILDLDTKSVVENLFNWAMTTACMHLITWNKAYAIFPYTTFIRKECYMVKELSDSVGDYVTEIEKEGIQVRSITWKQKGLSGNCDTLTRR
ncbi:hypothetical protein FB567DRAFT_588672 [Paraphoma chrysanthemicola]|uniref:F-box domain-containing protein n=1 Tax=Paraphoma chrysanthemicola TaxID=798071 RepID=A0A8K0W2U7_9PLEO|nr:hypothetical protein FB567DRAFT_588672 [Paraphoma chrysanthemicola]